MPKWTGSDPEPAKIISERMPCETAENGTGSRCTCNYDCANYWLRARGFKVEDRA